MSNRKRIVTSKAATPRQSAAMVAAVEQFLRDNAAPSVKVDGVDPWQRVARLQAVDRERSGVTPWGDRASW